MCAVLIHFQKPRKGRPLVKTRDGGYREYQSVSDPASTGHPTYLKNRYIGASQDMPSSPKWLPGNTWHYQQKQSSIMVNMIPFCSYIIYLLN